MKGVLLKEILKLLSGSINIEFCDKTFVIRLKLTLC